MEKKMKWQDWTNLVFGLWVFASPWALQHPMITGASEGAASGAMWNLWIVGVAVATLALIALFAFQAWEEWVNVTLGAWLLVSPWLLGFSSAALLTWNAVIMGVLIVVVAGWTLFPAPDAKKHSG
jgi:SPW repeat-containing protein